jgi:hypothetical protein
MKFRKKKHPSNIGVKYFKRVILSFLIFILLFCVFWLWFLSTFIEANRQACYKQETSNSIPINSTQQHEKALKTCGMNDK